MSEKDASSNLPLGHVWPQGGYMAIRERQGRARPFEVYWKNPFSGRIQSRSFETRQEAEKEDSLVKHRLRFERESFRQGINEQEQNQVSLESVYISYLREKQFPDVSMAKQISSMKPILALIGQYDIARIDSQDIRELYSKLKTPACKQATISYRMKKLMTLLRWAKKAGFIETVPDFPEMPKTRYERFVPPTSREIQAMLLDAPEHLQRVIILGSQCGVRVGPCEMFQLTWDDVDRQNWILRVHGSRKNLDAPWREVPIRESLQRLFFYWHKADMAIGMRWLVHFRGKPVRQIAAAWKDMLQKAYITRRIRPYDLRHAFATEMIASGVDIGTVAKLMGHNGPAMLLKHYQYVMDKQKRQAVEGLPDIAGMAKLVWPNMRLGKGLQ